MNHMSVSHLKELCEKYHLAPSKHYGQHYLLSHHVIQTMIDAANLQPSDTVVEIGPGFGVLTLPLAARVKCVIAFEIEKKIRPFWDEQAAQQKNITIHWGNALYQLPKMADTLPAGYVVAANLPYHITSNILRMILTLEKRPRTIVVMVQKEVADRICAKPGDMSLLAVSVQYVGRPRIAGYVPKELFWPVPKVDSAVVAIGDIQEKSRSHAFDDFFFRLVRAGFAHKRKQAIPQIAKEFNVPPSRIQEIFRQVSRDEKIRAEALSAEQWVQLANALIDRKIGL
ncbi:MAG TPA: ribosomal RNA small subunit methyltransferase A [Candidatus Magasanikbacteria bacterium]|nr:MAG: ribosomal RNA small subunit methyltransferase A [Candidatus Magasanikbacteria bacterium RIFCSPHIGHO2_02_FULL_48_18]HAZ28853.1 ribosomal RNA small subunit methyltransferase A [Candidatus Magasanikbacteria bacterium]